MREVKQTRCGHQHGPQGHYHRRAYVCCCIRAGEMDDGGGDATRIPVLGFTIGMALRARMAAGWWIFMGDCAGRDWCGL